MYVISYTHVLSIIPKLKKKNLYTHVLSDLHKITSLTSNPREFTEEALLLHDLISNVCQQIAQFVLSPPGQPAVSFDV